MRATTNLNSVQQLLECSHRDPFSLLGPHRVENAALPSVAVRAFLPHFQQAWVLDRRRSASQPMRRVHPAGLYEAICPFSIEQAAAGGYALRVVDDRGQTHTMHDPYSFPPLFTDFDLHLLGEGNHWHSYERLGAQLRTVGDVTGVNFAVWAPNASSVSVVGDFNRWDARQHPMRKHIPGGIWELFVPGIGPGEKYKYYVKHGEGAIEKADPYGFAAELPPKTASIVTELDRYQWGDEKWMEARRANPSMDRPISVYEVHLGSWRRGGSGPHGWYNYRELAHQLVEYCHEMGYTHIELLPISEHPYTGSWGYQTVGYYSVTSRYGTPEDFMYFVDYCHQNDLGVIIDWVPAHFPRDGHGLRRFDGSALYEHADPRQGEHPDWGTLIFNYSRNEVRNFLLSNALFWLDKYHIDGLRVDAVASMLYLDYSRREGEWIPNQFGGRENLGAISLLKEFNEQAHGRFPGVLTIAEESTAWGGVSHPTYTGGLGFSLKWNMGWMNDTLRYLRQDPIHRKFHHNELTFSLIYAFTENFVLPLSHDEVVHGKKALLDQMPGDFWQKFANLRLLFSYMWTHPGKKLLFMGSDFGQWHEWNCDAELQWDLLDWDTHGGIKKLVADLNALYRREAALHQVEFDEAGFEWLDCTSADDSFLAYIRRAKNPEDQVIVCCNFTPVTRFGQKLGVPVAGWYEEIFNSDSEFYGGSNQGNHPGVESQPSESHGRENSITFTLPPLGCVVFKPRTG